MFSSVVQLVDCFMFLSIIKKPQWTWLRVCPWGGIEDALGICPEVVWLDLEADRFLLSMELTN